jgi:hypothetical protein
MVFRNGNHPVIFMPGYAKKIHKNIQSWAGKEVRFMPNIVAGSLCFRQVVKAAVGAVRRRRLEYTIPASNAFGLPCGNPKAAC